MEKQDEMERVQEVVAVIVPIFFGLIAIVGLVGNSLVIFAVFANSKMRSTTNLLIVNLAIADLLFVVFCIPFTATDYVIRIWPFGDYWCRIVQYLVVVTAMTSIYTLVLMSFDRFLAVVHPVASKGIRTMRNTKLAIAIIWITVLIGSLIVPFVHGLAKWKMAKKRGLACQFKDATSFLPFAGYQSMFFCFTYLLPLLLISALYFRMVMQLWRSVPRATMSTDSRRGRRRVTRLVVAVVIAFALLWLPIQLILFLKSLDVFVVDSPFKMIIQVVAHILAYTSSCINPLLYAFLSENFRVAFFKAIHCSTKYQHYNCPTATAPRKTSSVGTCHSAL